MLPNGNAFVIGATGTTATYIPPANPQNPGTWQAGPTIVDGATNTLHPIDAPAALLPNGRVLLTASPAPPCNFPGPTSFFEYDPAIDTLNAVGAPSNAGGPCFTGRFLLLPNGQVLFSNQSNKVTVYTPDGTPNPAWKPVITAVPPIMALGHHYLLAGRQFNGLSQACFYGDDATMATNYPIARLEQGSAVVYCRTGRHSTMGVATGSQAVDTILSIPATVPPGNYNLVVVANGIPSTPVPVTIATALPALAVNIENGGDFGTVCGPISLELEIFNVGDLDLIVDKVLALPSPGDFSVAALPATPVTIKPGAEVEFTITFTPSTAGVTETGTIRILSNDPVSPTFDIKVKAAAGVGALFTAIADAGDFGKVCVGSFRDEQLTLSNNGNCKLTVTGVGSSSADFLPPSAVSYPLIIASGTAVELPIRFKPTSFGTKSATLTVASDDPAGPRTIPMSGFAPSGKLTVTGSTSFGGVTACCCADRTLSVCNTGDCALHVTSVRFKRKSSHWALLSNPFPATLHVGSCLNVVIRYKATEKCARSCELIIESDDPNTPVKVLEVLAYTIWDECGCKDCCEGCRKGGCEKGHTEVCCRQGYPCCDDDEEDDDQN